MTIASVIEMSGLLLIAAAFARMTVAATAFAAKGFRAKRRLRRDGAAFRVRAGRAFESAQSRTEPRPAPASETRKLRIVEKIEENLKGDICSFYLAPIDDRPLWAYRPGQFLTLCLSAPGHGNAVVRCYSLSETPIAPQRYYRITVKKLAPQPHHRPGAPPGLASSFLHDRLKKGDVVEVQIPAGSFCLDQVSDRPVVMIAAGVGITPLMSMLNWLVATQSQREIWVFYGARDRTEIAFAHHLKAMDRMAPNLHTVVFFSRPSAACRQGLDYDVEGYVNVDVIKALLRARDTTFYLCGPSRMMETVTADLRQWGVSADDIAFESFGVAHRQNVSIQSSPELVGNGPDKEFRIEFARSNKTVAWDPSFGTLLELAEILGLPARHSCRAGQCGTCKTPIKRGSVSYVRAPGAAIEAGNCLPCISQPAGDLVLDL